MITAIYHTLNEAEFIERSLRTVAPWAEEVIVFDNGSTDKTEAICRSFARVRWVPVEGTYLTKGETWMKEAALALARQPWVLFMDGDELLTDRWRERCEPLLTEVHGAVAIRMWEHVGSYEWVRAAFRENKHRLFRRHPGLRWVPSEVPRFTRLGLHGSFLPTADPSVVVEAEGVAFMHYGYARRDLKAKYRRNIERGDYTDDPREIRTLLERLERELVWSWLPPVEPAPYPIQTVPTPMRELHGRTYRLLVQGDRVVGREDLA
jgi:glycosyltransferase involved in cell wall biosynthesis